jgi:gliding motility-associated-like protein
MIKLFNVLVFFVLFLCAQAQDCNILIPPTNINGIDVTSSSTGSVSSYPSEFTSCGVYTTPANSVYMGGGGASSENCNNPFTYTLNFSEPVGGFSFIITAAGQPGTENFIFTTNAGDVTINEFGSCYTEIIGNEIISGLNGDGGGGGGHFEIISTEPFTSITISGDGCYNGSLFGICSETIVIPTLTASIGPSAVVCVGAPTPQLTFTGNGGNPPYTFTYNINGGASQTANAAVETFTLNVPTNNAGTFTYTITSVEDGDGNVTSTNASATVTVNTIVTPSFNAVAPYCAGAQIPALPVLSNNGVSGSWSPAINNTATTTYTFTPGAGQCANATTLTVEVNEIDVDLDPTIAVCPGEPVDFVVTGGPEPNTTYAWNVNGGTIIANNGGTITASFANGGNYTIQVTATEQGCFGIATQPMTVNADYDIILNESACDGYFWNGVNYTESGVYIDNTTSAFGCDSITTLNLTVNYSGSSLEQMETCDSYLWNGTSYTESGTYTFLTTTPQGCPFEETLELIINYSTSETINVPICEGDFYELPDGSQVAVSGVYPVLFSTIAGCDSLLVYNIATQTGPAVNFTATPTTTTVYEPDVTFYNLTQNSTQVFWDFGVYGTSEDQNPDVTIDALGAHPVCLTAWNDLGCETTACLDYIVTDAFYVYIPNAFTPDNDGINDVFSVQGTNIASDGFDLKIYNRWGEVVFETTNPEGYWMGEGSSAREYYSKDEVYVYRAVIKDLLTGNSYEFNGFVVLVR